MTKDFDKLKLPLELVESLSLLAVPPDQQEAIRLIGRGAEWRFHQAPAPKRKRMTSKFVVLCDVLRGLFADGRVPDRIGKRELHRMITLPLWREAWCRLIKTPAPEVPGRDTVDAARRHLNLPPAA